MVGLENHWDRLNKVQVLKVAEGSKANWKCFDFIFVKNKNKDCTCGLAVILALLVLKADGISVTLSFVVTINLSYTILFLTFTFLTAVVCVPHLVKLKRRENNMDSQIIVE